MRFKRRIYLRICHGHGARTMTWVCGYKLNYSAEFKFNFRTISFYLSFHENLIYAITLSIKFRYIFQYFIYIFSYIHFQQPRFRHLSYFFHFALAGFPDYRSKQCIVGEIANLGGRKREDKIARIRNLLLEEFLRGSFSRLRRTNQCQAKAIKVSGQCYFWLSQLFLRATLYPLYASSSPYPR